MITDLGIEKNKDFNLKPEDLARVKQAIREAAKSQTSAAAGEAPPESCC